MLVKVWGSYSDNIPSRFYFLTVCLEFKRLSLLTLISAQQNSSRRTLVALVVLVWTLSSTAGAYGMCCHLGGLPETPGSHSETGGSIRPHGDDHVHRHGANGQADNTYVAEADPQPGCVDVDMPDNGILSVSASCHVKKKDTDNYSGVDLPDWAVRQTPARKVDYRQLSKSYPEKPIYLSFQRFLE